MNEEITLNVTESSPYVIGAVAYVEQLDDGAKITIIDKNGTTTAVVSDGNGIQSVTLNEDYTLTIYYTDGASVTTTSIRGETGASGVYVGEDEPTDPDVDVWIDPSGESDEILIERYVDSWLDSHPEATTTVEDHSLTYEKLVVGTLGYVTPEMFGAKGDGVTDDTEAIAQALTYKNVIGANEYAISSPIYAQIDSDSAIMLNLKAISAMNYMLHLDAKGSGWDELVEGNFILRLDCNLMAKDGLRIDRFHNSNVDVIVKNFEETAVSVRHTWSLACGSNHINIFASNLETASSVSSATVGLKSGQDDIYDVCCANVKTAVRLVGGGNKFTNIHAWSSTEAWFLQAVVLQIDTDNENVIDLLCCDTMQVLFKLDNSGTTRYPKLAVRNLQTYNNSSVTVLPIYVWWLKDTTVFIPTIEGLFINRNAYAQTISWKGGTIPTVLIGDSATATDISTHSELAVRCSVITFKHMTVTGLDYLLNCEDCYYNVNGNTACMFNAGINGVNIVQTLVGYRASAHRATPITSLSWSYPWVDNSFNQRSFTNRVSFVAGTNTYELIKLSQINGILGSNIAAVMGTFANVTSQPKYYINGTTVYVSVDADWLTDNSGNKTFYGMIMTDGSIS